MGTANGSEQFNIAYHCTRKQCLSGLANKVALRWLAPNLERRDFTFGDLERASNQFANVLSDLDVQPGERVFSLLGKTPELFTTFLGALKIRAVASILFSSFGEQALFDRLSDAQASILITRQSFLKKIQKIRASLPELKYILVTDLQEHLDASILSYPALMEKAGADFSIPLTTADTPSVLHYTSGSTGKPKGALHAHRSLLQQKQTTQQILGLRADDIYWCTADQGWVTGVSYGIFGPWICGVTQVQYSGVYDPQRWFQVLEQERVKVWYTAPTVLRMMMQEDAALYQPFDLSALRDIFSVGEPLNPEIIAWAQETIGKTIYDTWFQTETGSIMIANHPDMPVKPGSMGKPVSGVTPAILADDGKEVECGKAGNLCIQPGWPSMFLTYYQHPEIYSSRFKGDYYYTGDLAYQDEEGYFWFLGRSDDVINSAGHLVSPFEVESSLLEIYEIADVGVIGAPDAILFEKVVAFLKLRGEIEWSKELELKIRLHVANKVSPIATPADFIMVQSIPKTRSGKIMRRLLKARYTGQDTGDLSTLEEE